MIPKAHITHWAAGAPWPSELQVEQDLILSRLIVDIANHDVLGPELAFRGGTCLHKLHLPTALRYSEDLDYVRTTRGPFLDRQQLPYTVTSPWFQGRGDIQTFALDELMATKLRALYQRRKGRDLFDLWHVLVALDTDDAQIVNGLEHYMRDDVFSYPQLAQNLRAKLHDADFTADLDALVTTRPQDYGLQDAADLVMQRLGFRLRNAPPLDDIRDGAWRA